MSIASKITHKKVSDLAKRDLIDLEGDRFADPHGTDELMEEGYAEVMDLTRKTIDGVDYIMLTVDLIWEQATVSFPPDHMVPFVEEL